MIEVLLVKKRIKKFGWNGWRDSINQFFSLLLVCVLQKGSKMDQHLPLYITIA